MARVTRKRSVFSLRSLDSSLSAKEQDENPFKKGEKLVQYEQPRQKRALQQLASADEVTGLNLAEHYCLNAPIHFTVRCGELEKGTLKVSCRPAKGAQIKVKPLGSHSYACTITPLQLGSHKIYIHYGHNQISGSPFHVTFNPPGNASACKIIETYPECQQCTEEDEMVFCVSTKDAGEGVLSASVKNTATKQHLPIEITTATDLDSDHFNVRFSPTEDTHYVLSVKYDNQHIQGSPFLIAISDASKCRTEGKGLKMATAENQNSFSVLTEKAGPGTLDVEIEGDGCTVDSSISSTTENEHLHKVTYVPTMPGTYKISVTWGGEGIPGSPFEVTCLTGPDASKCIVTGPNVPVEMNKPVELRVDASNAGNGQLAAKAVGDTSGSTDVKIDEVEPNVFNISLNPTTLEGYTLTVTWGDMPISGSPFHLNLFPPNPSEVEIAEFPSTLLQVGHPIKVAFDTSKAGRGKVTASCKGKKVNEVPVSVIQIPNTPKYDCEFTPPLKDIYSLSIQWGGKHIKGSPFLISLIPIDVSKVQRNGPRQILGRMGPVDFNMYTDDAGVHVGKVTATCLGTNSGKIPVEIKKTERHSYHLSFQPPQVDMYTFDVCYGGQQIPGSPYHVNTYPPDASKIKVTKPEKIQVGRIVTTTCDCTLAGAGEISASCIGEKHGAIELDVTRYRIAHFDITFNPILPDIYTISITWGGHCQQVPGLPHRYNLLPPDPEKVIVGELHIPEKAGTKELVWLDLDCSHTGPGAVKAECRGDSAGDVPVKVKSLESDRHLVAFNPKQDDLYKLSIYYADKPLPNSPFLINLIPPQPDKVEHTATSLPEEKGAPAVLSFDTSKAGRGGLTAKAVGESAGPVPVQVKETAPNYFNVLLQSPIPDIYTVDVYWEEKPVKGSPFVINLHPPDPEKVIVGELHIPEKAGTKDPVWLDLDCIHTGPGAVKAECRGESAGDVPVRVKSLESDTYKVKFKPKKSDLYKLSVYYADKHVPNSPFLINLIPPQPDKVEHTATSLPEEKGAPAVLSFDTSKAGRGGLTAKAVGESAGPVPVQVKETAPNYFNVLLQSPIPDIYTVDVYWEEKPVKGSPFVINLHPPDPEKVIVGELHIPEKAGTKDLVWLDLDCAHTGPGAVKAECRGDSAGDVPVRVKSLESDRYKVKFKPKKSDLYKLSVYYADKHVPNSPFLINLIPPQPDKVEHTATSLPEEKGAPAVLSFDTSKAGRGGLTAKAVGESAGPVPVQVKETAPNYFNVLLQSPIPDIYTVDVYWEEKPVKGSPFVINLHPPDPEKVIVGELHIPEKAGTKDLVWLDLDCTHTGPGAVKAECRGDSAGDVPVRVKSLESDRYKVKFKPKRSDLYKLSVYYADKHVPNSPFLINLIPPQPDKVEHTATSFPEEKGAPAVLSFDTSKAGRGGLTAKAVGESAGPVPVQMKETAPNYFNVLLQSPIPDIYTVDVYWEEKPVKGSPFVINLLSPNASKVKVTEPKAVACSSILIYKCNASDAGAGDITATCEGKESGNIEVAVLKRPSSQYEVAFTLHEPDIYTLSIKWAGEEVPKSPVMINLLPPDPEEVIVGELHIPETAGTKDPVWLDLDCSHTGPGEATVDCKGETVGRVQANVRPRDNDVYRVKFLPKVGDVYTLSILYGSGEVPGSPFTVDLLPSYPENVKLTATESPKEAGGPFSLTFDTSKAGKGSLNAIATSDSRGPVPLEVKHEGSHAYKVLVTPPYPDVYKVAVYWVDVPVKDSPFTIDARHPEYIHCSEPSFTKVGEPVSMTVDTSKAGPGKITAKCSGKLCGTVPIKITATTSSLYTLSFLPKKEDVYSISVLYDGTEVKDSPCEADLCPHTPIASEVGSPFPLKIPVTITHIRKTPKHKIPVTITHIPNTPEIPVTNTHIPNTPEIPVTNTHIPNTPWHCKTSVTITHIPKIPKFTLA